MNLNWQCAHCRNQNTTQVDFQFDAPKEYTTHWACSKCGNISQISFALTVSVSKENVYGYVPNQILQRCWWCDALPVFKTHNETCHFECVECGEKTRDHLNWSNAVREWKETNG